MYDMGNSIKRFLALALAVFMVIGMMPTNFAFAEETHEHTYGEDNVCTVEGCGEPKPAEGEEDGNTDPSTDVSAVSNECTQHSHELSNPKCSKCDYEVTTGYLLFILNEDGTVGMTIDGSKSASAFCMKTAIEDARVFVNNAFLFGITTPATYVVEMYEDSTENASFEIGSDVTINGNGHKIVCAEGVVVTNNGTLNNVTIEEPADPAEGKVAQIDTEYFETLEAAFAAAVEGENITLLADATPALTSQRAITKAAVIDLNGKTLTLTEDDLYFGTTTFKNGTIVVAPSVRPSTAVFWMFANQTLTFDNVKIVATGVTGTYLIGLEGVGSDLNLLNGSEILIENTTALDLDVICVNGSTDNDIVIQNSKVNVTNLDGRVFFRGNYTVGGTSDINLSGITKAGFRIEAGQTLTIADTATVDIEGEPRDGGIHLTDVTATYTKADTATVNATVVTPDPAEGKVAKVGDVYYETLSAAFAAVTADTDTVTVLDDVTENITGAYLRGNIVSGVEGGVSITVTNSDWLYAPYAFKIGEGVTFNVPALFLYCGNAVIEGKVVAGAYYQRYAGTKLTIKEPGSMTVTSETFILRYMDGDPNAGIYIVGDKDDATVGLNLAVAYFYQGMINAKDANIKVGTYWQTNETDGQGSANLVLDNSKLSVTTSEHNFMATGNSTVTLTNGSQVTVAGEHEFGSKAVISIDPTSSFSDKNGALKLPVAQIGEQKYTSLQDAIDAAVNGNTITLLADCAENVTLTEAVGLYYTIDGNGKTMNGTITVKALSDTNDNRRITIKNINFKSDEECDFISAGASNYYPRLTVEACTFTGNGKAENVAIRLKDSSGVIIKDCTGTGLHSFLQNTAGWNLTVENVTVTNSKGGLALGTVQGVTVKDCDITATGYGIRMDAQYNNNAVIENNTVEAFIPVVVRKASVDSNVTFQGTNEMTATNNDGIWMAIGTSEYEENGKLPTAATSKVNVTLTDSGLEASGIYGASNTGVSAKGTWGGIDWTLTKDGTLTIAPTAGEPVPDKNAPTKRTYEVGEWREAVVYKSNGSASAIGGYPYDVKAVKKLIIEEGVTKIGSFTAQFPNLTGEVVIPSTVTYIGQEAFAVSTKVTTQNITKLTFAEGGTGPLCIANGAFKRIKIEEIAFPGDREYIHIHHWAFQGSPNLTTAYIPANVTKCWGGEHVDYFDNFNSQTNPSWTYTSSPFTGCTKMETITFENEAVRDLFFGSNRNSTAEDPIVAYAGLTGYNTFDEAFEAALKSGETLGLAKNVNKQITIEDKTFVLDLNGRTLNGSILAPNANLTIKGGKIVNTNSAVSALEINAGELTLTNVNIDSARHAVRIDGAVEATIEGGTYRGAIGTGTGTYHAVNVSGNAKVTIVDGTFTGAKGTSADSGAAVNVQSGATVIIEGGSFSGGKNNTLANAGELAVSGGTYDQDPSAYVPEGYDVKENSDGTYSVVKGLMGKGSVDAPYQIATVEDLILFRDSVNAGETKYNASGVYVALTADIDLASVENWEPIGNWDATFDGNFDGQGNKIMNLKMTDTAAAGYMGFFGITANNTIKDFKIENVTINSNGQIVAAAIAYPYYTTVKNITVSGDISIKGGDYTAGVLGYTRLCENASNLTVSGNAGSTITGAQVVGGVIADIQMNHGLVANYSNFKASGVTISGTKMVGGISGIIATQTLNGATVENVTLECGDARVGTVAGAFGGTCTISNVNVTNVTGATAVIGNSYDGDAPVQAKIGDTYYATLATAESKAQAGDEITLLANGGAAEAVAKAVIIVKNGYTATVTAAEGYIVEESDDSYVVKKVLKGTGTETDPFQIATVEDLILFRDSVNEGETKYNAPGVYVALAADIDMASVENWEPIGNWDATFDGNFDGKGHKIMNLKISDDTAATGEAYLGFFGITANNTIENFVIENVSINSNGQIVAAAIAYPYYTTVKNITVCGNIAIKGGNYTAGVLGYTRFCENASNLTVSGNAGSTITGAQVVGGVIADIQMNKGLIANYSNFSASGLTITGTKMVGGISGIIATQTLNGATVENVTLECGDARVGTVAGAFGGTCTISNVKVANVTGATAVIGNSYDGNAPVQAKIGDTYYATLEAALAATEGDEVTLLVPYVVEKGEEVTLDLNGKTVSVHIADQLTKSFAAITNKGTLTVTDSVGGGKISVSYGGESFGYGIGLYTISNEGGTLTIAGGTVENLATVSGSMYDAIDNNSTLGNTKLEITGGAVVCNGYIGIRQFCNTTKAENIVNISGGTVTGGNTSVWMQNPSSSTNKGTLEITGGTVNGRLLLGSSDAFSAAVSGGTFSVAVPEEFCAEGYIPADNGDGTYGVKEGKYVAQIGETKYETVQAAVDAAEAGASITMIADSEEAMVMLKNGVTLDLNGNTLTTNYFITLHGTQVLNSKTTGILKVPQTGLSLQLSNTYVPVWNEVDGYYLVDWAFSTNLKQMDETTVRYSFLAIPRNGTTFNYDVAALLKNGAEDNQMKIVVRFSWKAEELGTMYQMLDYNTDMVSTVYTNNTALSGNGTSFYVTITGYENYDEITVRGVVVSDMGMEDTANAKYVPGDAK